MKCPCGKTHGSPRKLGTAIHEEVERLRAMPDGQWRDTFTRTRVSTWPAIGTGAVVPPPAFEWSAGEMTLENGTLYPGTTRLSVEVPRELLEDQPFRLRLGMEMNEARAWVLRQGRS